MKILAHSLSIFATRSHPIRQIVVSIPLFFFFAFPIISSNVSAETESIIATNLKGQRIYLYKNYYALVVGASNYDKWPSLPNAIKDARDLSWLLRRLGFEVTLLADPTSTELKKALNDLVKKTGQELDRGILFYYEGHGETQTLSDGTKLGWIIPRDCPLLHDDPEGFANQAISTKSIAVACQEIQSRHVVMLFDSSFSGEVFSLHQAILKPITKKSMQPVRQFIIAGSEGEPIPDQSTFKRCLVKALQGEADVIHDGYLTGSELGVYLTDCVEKKTGGRQHPQFGEIKDPNFSHGDFVFRLTEKKLNIARLFVDVVPDSANIKILNIQPRFFQGIELDPGKYHVEVSAEDHETQRTWIDLKAGEDRTVDIRLNKIKDLLTNTLEMTFSRIRPGRFVMGSSDNESAGLSDEKEHTVTLNQEFFMQTTEVTVGQFRQFVQETGYKTEAEGTGGCWISTKGTVWKKRRGSSWESPGYDESAAPPPTDNLPVTCVTWNDAQAFVKWLTGKEGKTYSLPTEAEWEYACRAGTTTPFSYGKCLSTDQANYGKVGPHFPECKAVYQVTREQPTPAGSLAPNPWKLFDMHGNVSEWCQDWYGPYSKGPVTDPKGPSTGTERVMRGGHLFSDAHDCRSARRGKFPPGMASNVLGFRLVLRP
jgi:formylglycine-generating enzyme required for sulfatase activity